nr:heterocycloanthracin/sonorensin family bacteriocin [Bacillus licheniformis]
MQPFHDELQSLEMDHFQADDMTHWDPDRHHANVKHCASALEPRKLCQLLEPRGTQLLEPHGTQPLELCGTQPLELCGTQPLELCGTLPLEPLARRHVVFL